MIILPILRSATHSHRRSFTHLPSAQFAQFVRCRYRYRCLSSLSLSNATRGNHFEKCTIAVLEALQLPLTVTHRGKANDEGIDLVGEYRHEQGQEQGTHTEALSSTKVTASPSAQVRQSTRILIQCKCEKRKTGAEYIRSLEGVIRSYSRKIPIAESAENGHHIMSTELGTIGMMVSASDYTAAANSYVLHSSAPLILVQIDPTIVDRYARLDQMSSEAHPKSSANEAVLLKYLRRFWLNPAAAFMLPTIQIGRQIRGQDHYLIVRDSSESVMNNRKGGFGG